MTVAGDRGGSPLGASLRRRSSYFGLSSAKVAVARRQRRMIAGVSRPARPTRPSTRSSSSSTRSASGGRGRAPSSSSGPGSAGRSSPSGSASSSSAASSSRAIPGPSTGGRPPRQLTFRADAGHLLVADLGATSIDVALTTLDGRILGHHDEPAEIEAGPGGRPRPGRGAVRPAAARRPRACPGRLWGIGIARAGPGRVRDRPADLAADHARLGRLPDPRAVRGPLRRAGLGRQRRQRPRPRRVALRGRRRPRRRRRRSRSGPGSAPGSSPAAGSIAAPRAAPATSATSRSPTIRRSICRCGNVGCLEALAGGGGARPGRRAGGPRRAVARACGPRSTSAAASPPRTSRGRRRPAIRSRSRCSSRPAGGSARCSRAS